MGDPCRQSRRGNPETEQGPHLPRVSRASKGGGGGHDGGHPGGLVHGIPTRPVGDLVKAMGMSGVSKRQVSRLCAEIDERVNAFLNRPLEGEWPRLWLDAPASSSVAAAGSSALPPSFRPSHADNPTLMKAECHKMLRLV